MAWRHPNTITGPAAEGSKYFQRPRIEGKIWNEIEKGNHVLFLAPRRVGKSSIVKYLSKNDRNGFISHYENIQSDRSLQDFYKRMSSMALKALTNAAKGKKIITQWTKRWRITNIGASGISIEAIDIDYRKDFFELLEALKKQDQKIVLYLDEFPDVLKKIYHNSGKEDAETLLDDTRGIRHNEAFNKVFVMVLLGSVGLKHIVKQIMGRDDKVNDLHKEYLHPLKQDDALDFIDHLVIDATMQLDGKARQYILEKIGYHIPYYLQLMIEECDNILFEETRTDLINADIDKAYESLIRKNEYFNDWQDRLTTYFSLKSKFLIEVLIKCAHAESITLQEIYNIAIGHNAELTYKSDLDDILMADGYLSESDNTYNFNSPLLRDWWKRQHPIMTP